jgi:hypothetical protein
MIHPAYLVCIWSLGFISSRSIQVLVPYHCPPPCPAPLKFYLVSLSATRLLPRVASALPANRNRYKGFALFQSFLVRT